MVFVERLELSCLSAADFESAASSRSATRTFEKFQRKDWCICWIVTGTLLFENLNKIVSKKLIQLAGIITHARYLSISHKFSKRFSLLLKTTAFNTILNYRLNRIE